MRQVGRRGVLRGLAGIGALAATRTPTWAAQCTAAAEALAPCTGDRMLGAFSTGIPNLNPRATPLEEFSYGEVEQRGQRELAQRTNTQHVLMGLRVAELLRPIQQMSGTAPPGQAGVGAGLWGERTGPSDPQASGIGPDGQLGGWYCWRPDYDFHHDDAGFAPASTLGQWTSALSRMAASAGIADGPAMQAHVLATHTGLRQSLRPGFFAQTRFPAYTFDKLVCGLVDSHQLIGDTKAWDTLEVVRSTALPSLPGRGLNREIQDRMGLDQSFMWDEPYTLPENLYRAYSAGAGSQFRTLAQTYLDDAGYFGPLARGEVAMADRHAYSYTNALCSAMQAWFVDGSRMHLQAAINGWAMIEAQSFATGGWGPDEQFRKPGYGEVLASLTRTHNSFEVPCGSFAQMKLMRYLLRATGDGRYGDSMERIIWNAALGALPLQPDGHSFYYADYNDVASKVYSDHRWPCCSGTLPQVAADYGVSGFLREPGAVWVVLYGASVARWHEGGEAVEMEIREGYPENGHIRLDLRGMRQPLPLTVKLRVPRWAGASCGHWPVRLNGQLLQAPVQSGFASICRIWRPGDTIELDFPMNLRLEAMPSELPPGHLGSMPLNTVALCRGPEVLFPVHAPGDAGMLAAHDGDLLQGRQTGPREWRAQTTKGERRFVPWTELGTADAYSTYIKLA